MSVKVSNSISNDLETKQRNNYQFLLWSNIKYSKEFEIIQIILEKKGEKRFKKKKGVEREPIRSGRPSPPEGVPNRSSSKICSSHDSSPLPLPSPPPSPSCCFAAGRKIECEHGRSICPKESLIFGRCPPTIFVLVENYISPGRGGGRTGVVLGEPEEEVRRT